MNLAERLQRLQSQAGTRSPVPPAPPSVPVAPAPLAGPSLKERLERMATARSRSAESGLASLIRLTGATALTDDLLCVEWRRPLPWRHGSVEIDLDADAVVSLPLRQGHAVRQRARELLFLDTETTGVSGGTGTVVFLLGLLRFCAGEIVVRQYVATRFSSEPAMLGVLGEAVRRAGCLVTYNGKSFDVPLLRTRYGMHRESSPFEGMPHCDLLHATRRLLRDGWTDCRLQTAERHALGFSRLDDLPGAEVPAAWQRWVRHADPSPVVRILDHNREDLVSLAAIVHRLTSLDVGAPLFGATPRRSAPAGVGATRDGSPWPA